MMIKTIKVSGKDLSLPTEVWDKLEGPKPPDYFESNGCSFSPDRWRRFRIWPACHIHDYHYQENPLPGNWKGRRQADKTFRKNIKILLKEQKANKRELQEISWIYWGRVRVWGARSYRQWDEGEQPLTMWQRVKEAWRLA